MQANGRTFITPVDDGLTPLGIAISEGKMKMVQVLADHGANFHNDADTNLALGHAIEQLEADMVDFLLSHGASPMKTAVTTLVKSFIDRHNDEELHEDNTYAKFVRILSSIVPAGANVDPYKFETDRGDSPLTIAARIPGSKILLCSLLSFEADVTSVSSETFDPILTAALFGQTGDVTCLLEHAEIYTNSDHWSWFLKDIPMDKSPILRICLCLKRAGTLDSINKSGRTLLHLAAERGNIPLITSLLSCGARADIEDTEGFLPMQYAGFSRSAAGLLLLFPFSINTTPGTYMQRAPKEHRRIVHRILERRNASNQNMFDVAMEHNDTYLASLLLQFRVGADSWLRIGRELPSRPLHYAAERGRIDMVSLLLSRHASIEAKDRFEWRALHVACYRGHMEIVKMLIQEGANIHTMTRNWYSDESRPSMMYRWTRWKGRPLHVAAMGGHADVVKLLLEHGANIHASTGKSVSSPGHGPTALHLALDTGGFYNYQSEQLSAERLEIAQMLVDRGAMVKGVIRDFSLEEILRFKNFPRLWDALVAGDS